MFIDPQTIVCPPFLRLLMGLFGPIPALPTIAPQLPADGIPLVGYVPPTKDINLFDLMGVGNIAQEDSNYRAAQEIIHDAWEEFDPETRGKMAQQALKISEYCVDAHFILADDLAATNQEKLNYYQKGIEIGEQFLGEDYFNENQGHFWGLIETRPYMRALVCQANSLWVTGDKKNALKIYRRLLELNPGDNQGIRYLLLNALLEIENYQDAETLIMEYPDIEDAVWLFTKALLEYKDAGATPGANKKLVHAHEFNPFVKNYLTGKKRVPHYNPPYHGWGDEDEAIIYVKDHLNHWRKVPGAIEWLKSITDK